MSFWDNFLEEMRSLGETLLEWAILIVVALAILVVGRWILKWVRRVIEKVLGMPALDPLWDKSGVSKALEPSEQTPASILASVTYAYLMVVLFLIVVRVLKIDSLEDLLERLVAWIPIVLLAGAIVLISAAVANWTADLVRPFANDNDVPWVTWLTKIGIIVFGLLFALDLLEVTFAEDVVKIAVIAVGATFAIAFGIGGIDTAKKWWAQYGAPKGGGSKPTSSHTPSDSNF